MVEKEELKEVELKEQSAPLENQGVSDQNQANYQI